MLRNVAPAKAGSAKDEDLGTGPRTDGFVDRSWSLGARLDRCPSVQGPIVYGAGAAAALTAPDNHRAARPNGHWPLAARDTRDRQRFPAVSFRIITSAARPKETIRAEAAPK